MSPRPRYRPVGKRILDAPGRIQRPAEPPPDRIEHLRTTPDGAEVPCACILGDDHTEGRDA